MELTWFELEQIADKDRPKAINIAFRWWMNQSMPVRYRDVRLKTLEPSDKNRLRPATQQWFYDEVRNHIDDGFMIFGPVGTGKTTVAMGYYRYWLSREIERISSERKYGRSFANAVLRPANLAVWKQEAKTLLLEHHDWAINRPRTSEEGIELGGAKTPLVTSDKIRHFARAGIVPRFVLEEIDKVELTKARRDTLFDILNTLDAECGKFFINTNLTPDEFEDMYGAEFVRRIKQSCRVIDLYAKEKQ